MDRETFFKVMIQILRLFDILIEILTTNRKVDVSLIYAYKDVEDIKLLHAANIMAQYLDNDEDGIVDNFSA